MEKQKICIIGGGLTGLVTAIALSRLNLKIDLITGDVTQIDLPLNNKSGLVDAVNNLKKVKDISFVNLTDKDVVRHPLVQKIIKAYEK